jgi:phosphoglucosamine mutase
MVSGMEKYPQVLINVRTAKRVDLKADAGVQRVQAEVEARLAGAGRVVLRASGTEPVIRVMVEASDADTARAEAEALATAVRAAAA